MTRRGRCPTWVLPSCAIVLGLIMAAWGLGWAPGTDVADAVPPSHTAAAPATVANRSPAPRIAGRPVRLIIPALGVRAPVDPVDAPDGDLEIPGDPGRVGWWQAGAAPGAEAGTVLIAGHVDTAASGPGALFWLDRLHPGDAVTVATTSGDVHYVVATLRRYPKADLPRSVATPAGAPGLAIVTCGGAFDRRARSYLDNVVVAAVPA
ncbi:class F sortase [Actinomycetospora endophytica]|uniref:Class F sortase n=1 Tax=Actinomycetospora endophytica TaxID=2291215 RepID=A0ABS8PCZ5_9PSEU|nr:class F sortase [Actinomycetospora endophytica]MCD2196126.1 class F sortase [Actinomycetospora endophytica]